MEQDVREVDLKRISPNRRLIFDGESIEELCRCIRLQGQLEPIRIWLAGDLFRILDGEKRWRACKRLGWKRMKAILIEASTGEPAH